MEAIAIAAGIAVTLGVVGHAVSGGAWRRLMARRRLAGLQAARRLHHDLRSQGFSEAFIETECKCFGYTYLPPTEGK